MNHRENKKGALEENTGGDIYSPPRRRVAHLPSTSDRRPSRTEDERESDAPSHHDYPRGVPGEVVDGGAADVVGDF